MFAEEFLDAGYVFGDVYADGVVLDFGDADFPSVFEPAELFELLDSFELSLWQRRVFEQGIALENVKPQVLPVFDVDFLLGVADPGDWRARKIKPVAFEIENCFHDVGIHDVAGVPDRSGDGGDLGGRFFEERGYRGIDCSGVDKRFVTLYVYEDVALFVDGHLCDTFCAGAVVGAGHAGFATEGVDGVDNALVVRGYHNVMNGLRLPGAFIHALDHGLAGERD